MDDGNGTGSDHLSDSQGTANDQGASQAETSPETGAPASSKEEVGAKEAAHSKINRWQPYEHALLQKLVQQYGEKKKWSKIAALIPGRTGKQCRERWMNHLRPMRKDKWTNAEGYTLAMWHSKIGSQWTAIARHIPGRTENSIKNHWNSTSRSKTTPTEFNLLWEYHQHLKAGQDPAEAFAKASAGYIPSNEPTVIQLSIPACRIPVSEAMAAAALKKAEALASQQASASNAAWQDMLPQTSDAGSRRTSIDSSRNLRRKSAHTYESCSDPLRRHSLGTEGCWSSLSSSEAQALNNSLFEGTAQESLPMHMELDALLAAPNRMAPPRPLSCLAGAASPHMPPLPQAGHFGSSKASLLWSCPAGVVPPEQRPLMHPPQPGKDVSAALWSAPCRFNELGEMQPLGNGTEQAMYGTTEHGWMQGGSRQHQPSPLGRPEGSYGHAAEEHRSASHGPLRVSDQFSSDASTATVLVPRLSTSSPCQASWPMRSSPEPLQPQHAGSGLPPVWPGSRNQRALLSDQHGPPRTASMTPELRSPSNAEALMTAPCALMAASQQHPQVRRYGSAEGLMRRFAAANGKAGSACMELGGAAPADSLDLASGWSSSHMAAVEQQEQQEQQLLQQAARTRLQYADPDARERLIKSDQPRWQQAPAQADGSPFQCGDASRRSKLLTLADTPSGWRGSCVMPETPFGQGPAVQTAANPPTPRWASSSNSWRQLGQPLFGSGGAGSQGRHGQQAAANPHALVSSGAQGAANPDALRAVDASSFGFGASEQQWAPQQQGPGWGTVRKQPSPAAATPNSGMLSLPDHASRGHLTLEPPIDLSFMAHMPASSDQANAAYLPHAVEGQVQHGSYAAPQLGDAEMHCLANDGMMEASADGFAAAAGHPASRANSCMRSPAVSFPAGQQVEAGLAPSGADIMDWGTLHLG